MAKKKAASAMPPLPEDLTTVELRNMRNGWCIDESDTHDRCDPVIANPGGAIKWLRCPCDCHDDLWDSDHATIAATSRTAAAAWTADGTLPTDPPLADSGPLQLFDGEVA